MHIPFITAATMLASTNSYQKKLIKTTVSFIISENNSCNYVRMEIKNEESTSVHMKTPCHSNLSRKFTIDQWLHNIRVHDWW